jgi:hypothetical protein
MLGDSAILCVDSLEVVSDYAKTTTQKIRTLHSPGQWRIGLAGAGDSACIDLCQEELWRKLPPASFDYSQMVRIIRETVHGVHEQHVWPRQSGGNPPSFQLLIALQGLNPRSRSLFYSQDSVVLPVDKYKGIGIGAYLSDYLHERSYPNETIYKTRTEEAARIEIAILDEVKSAIHGCDGETLVAIFHGDGTFRYMLGNEVHEIEGWFSGLRNSELPIFHAVAYPEMDDQDFERRLRQFEANMRLLRAAQARDAKTHADRSRVFLEAQQRADQQPEAKRSASGTPKTGK